MVALAALAGCADGGGTADEAPTGTRGTSEEPTGDDVGTDTLDRREANVVDVSFAERDGAYTFDVTLDHDDDGEAGYANRWQVERLDGTRLGRRELLHAHSRQPFTRSETIDVPEDVTCVVVRGHDQTHGYGGLAAAVDLRSGETRLRDQGSERRVFDADDRPGAR